MILREQLENEQDAKLLKCHHLKSDNIHSTKCLSLVSVWSRLLCQNLFSLLPCLLGLHNPSSTYPRMGEETKKNKMSTVLPVVLKDRQAIKV